MNYITIGTFDGVHKGHRQLLSELKSLAQSKGLTPMVIYIDVPPKIFFTGNCNSSLLTLPTEREALIKKLGINLVQRMAFTDAFANMEKDDFCAVLTDKYKMKGLLAGRDFAFGKNREGNLEYMRKTCQAKGVELKIIDFFTDGEHKISSSLIRRLLLEGKIPNANLLLGYNYFMRGTVVHGKKLARTLGWPTANLEIDARKFLPPGIYASKVTVEGKEYGGVSSIGFRPTTDNDTNLMHEVHILNFNRDIYGQTIKTELIQKIRNERKFAGLEELKNHVLEDIKQASSILNKPVA